jgi:hypothetical protein
MNNIQKQRKSETEDTLVSCAVYLVPSLANCNGMINLQVLFAY